MKIFAPKKQAAPSPSNLNKKIDKKLDTVAEIFEGAAVGCWQETKKSLFHKTLLLQNFRYLEHLNLKYNYENRFFSISYNLEMSTALPAKKGQAPQGDCVFQAQNAGKFRRKKPIWVCKAGEDAGGCLERLNHSLILDRIDALDMTRVTARYQAAEGEWSIRCESMIGSATWILIPPVINLIKPTMEECVKVLEFFELTADAVANNQ